MMYFICYPKCSTCKKAEAFLKEKKADYVLRNIQLNNPSKEELRTWVEKSGLELRRFYNTSGLKYKELKLKEKLPEMSFEEQLELLASDGMLVKRPLLIGDDFVLVGFKQAEWERAL